MKTAVRKIDHLLYFVFGCWLLFSASPLPVRLWKGFALKDREAQSQIQHKAGRCAVVDNGAPDTH